ncbi:hypothetical protein [Flavobacterium sp.]|jgi:hypothetical protein|uniref:hypothetical protein n=1 Tax=Flavobacterium sp. TaxID=239 RepID=UPI0037BEAF9D
MSNYYGVQVVFNERGYWSKPYTYLHEESIPKDTPVIVETQNFYSVGKVVSCIKDPKLDPKIKYKIVKRVGLD